MRKDIEQLTRESIPDTILSLIDKGVFALRYKETNSIPSEESFKEMKINGISLLNFFSLLSTPLGKEDTYLRMMYSRRNYDDSLKVISNGESEYVESLIIDGIVAQAGSSSLATYDKYNLSDSGLLNLNRLTIITGENTHVTLYCEKGKSFFDIYVIQERQGVLLIPHLNLKDVFKIKGVGYFTENLSTRVGVL